MHIFLITLCCFFFFFQFSVPSNSKSDFIILNQSITDGETLVSSGRRFELGFFTPGNSQNRYLGIWQKVTPETVIWVANYNNPITDYSGVLTVTKTEGLVILNQTGSNTIIWSSNSSTVAERSLVLQLLDSGNLVLVESSSGSYLWQSFNYPSNTVLPGMKLGWNSETGQEQYLTSWKSASDPSPGEFTYKLQSNGLPQLVVGMGDTKIFRSGPWNGFRFNGFAAVINSVFEPILVLNKDNNMYTMYETYNDSVFTRNTLNESGLLNRYVAKQSSTEWALLFTRPYDLCDEYGKCGPNGVCKIYQSTICECLKGFIPKSKPEWDVLDWSHGCRRRTPLNCQSGEGFVKVVNVKLPDLLKFWLNKSMSLEECKGECLKNCSCVAYTNSNITAEGSGCLMWFGDLIDIREFIEEYTGQDIYIRLASSELESMRNSKKKKRLEIIVVVVSTISAILTLGLICWWIIWKKRSMAMGRGEDWELPLFDLTMIVTATNNFSQANMIGGGGFGSVYKGYLPTGQEIAVKRLSKSSQQGLEEFKNEVVSIAKLQHRNLVKLLGCCVQGEERILIYEFMPNKSLDYFIFDKSDSTMLSWQQRYDIALGIARGLLYLHQDSRLKIIHRDLKTSNILLDCNMNPKISDFGLARIFGGDENIYAKTKRIVGTYGYMSPEYAIDGKFSVKSDVFSFGVLMLEIVSGKKNRGFSHPDHHHTLLGHAWLLWNEDKCLEVMDPRLMDSFVETQALRCVQVALLCVQKHPADRPTMSSVVFMLGSEGATLSKPKQPGFFIERSSTDTTTQSNEECYTKNSLTITMLEAR